MDKESIQAAKNQRQLSLFYFLLNEFHSMIEIEFKGLDNKL